MNCPKCIGILKTIRLTQHHIARRIDNANQDDEFLLEIDKCFSCGGVWFDKGELDKYLEKHITAIDSSSLGKELDRKIDEKVGTCPHCAIELEKSPAAQDPKLTIDVCQNCQGVWLDPPEIDTLERANRSGNRLIGALLEVFKYV
jgi:Zn-finger nucleic acid-binding protein